MTSHCFDNHDLNPETCKFVKKCPPGMVRNENFRCVKAKEEPEVIIKKKVEKRKGLAEKRLRERVDILRSRTDKFFNNGNNTENSNSHIKDALMRLRRQTIKKDAGDLTENVTAMIERINAHRKSKRPTKTRTPRRKPVVINTGTNLNEFNSFDEDLRSKSPNGSTKASPAEVDLKSPNSPREQKDDEKVKAYRNIANRMMATLNFGKLNKMTKRRKPKATLKSRKNASLNKMGTSLNGPRKRSNSNISL